MSSILLFLTRTYAAQPVYPGFYESPDKGKPIEGTVITQPSLESSFNLRRLFVKVRTCASPLNDQGIRSVN